MLTDVAILLGLGFAAGYGLRAWISIRRRRAIRKARGDWAFGGRCRVAGWLPQVSGCLEGGSLLQRAGERQEASIEATSILKRLRSLRAIVGEVAKCSRANRKRIKLIFQTRKDRENRTTHFRNRLRVIEPASRINPYHGHQA